MGHEEQPLPQSWQDWTPSAVKWYNLCVKSWNEIRKAATAKRMLKDGILALKDIARYSGLSLAQVKKLQASMA